MALHGVSHCTMHAVYIHYALFIHYATMFAGGTSHHIPRYRLNKKWQRIALCDIIMTAKVSQITGVSIVCSTICSGADQRKHQSSASLAFARGIPSQRASNAENVSILWRPHGQFFWQPPLSRILHEKKHPLFNRNRWFWKTRRIVSNLRHVSMCIVFFLLRLIMIIGCIVFFYYVWSWS